MKVFLSYGHDVNSPLVERIRVDLGNAGHDVWIDTARIKAGEDWRRSITEGLIGSDWVLGFLSKHSVREPGVCLDELAIALHHKAGAIATVLLEGEAAAPLSVSHIQWLDMHEWAARQAGGGTAWETWYADKRDAILAMLASPDVARFAGEISELDGILKPASQTAEIAIKVEGFVGREWLLAKLEAWRTGATESRLLWIAGAAGTGKSAFAAWLGHRGKVNVIGLNLCAYNNDDRRDAGRVIRTLAFQVATRLPDARLVLLDRLRRLKPKLDVQTPTALFTTLLVEPLGRLIDGGRSGHRFLIVIDALDETVTDGRSELAEVLAAEAHKLPPWIAIVVTSRPEEPINRQFGALSPLTIDAAAPENVADLRDYIRDWLGEGQDAAAHVDRILSGSEGNFLYVRMLRDAVKEGTLRLDAPGGLPKGLGALYERWFRHRFPDKARYDEFRPLLQVLVAAEHPVPDDWLARIFGWSAFRLAGALEDLGSLFEQRAEGVAPFHKSLRDWLGDRKAAGAFAIDVASGTEHLAVALWAAFMAWSQRDADATLDAFCLVELPIQVRRFEPHHLRALIATNGGWDVVQLGLFDVCRQQKQRFAWGPALAWWEMIAMIAMLAGEDRAADRAYALTEAGDISRIVGLSAAALQSYRAGLVIRERLAASDRANAEWQRDLSLSYNKVGDVLVAQGDRVAAMESYRAGLVIQECLAASDRANAEWQRDLSVSYERVGDVLVAQGDRVAALQSYRAGLVIAERLAASDRANAEWQRDLSVSYNKVGDVLVAQGDRVAALQSYRAGLVIAERLAASDRANAEWQRDLSVSYNRVGDVLVAQGDRAAALQSYRAGLVIRERLAASDRANAEWQRDLSVSDNRVGDVLVAQGDRAAALQSYRAGLVIAERLAASDRANAEWQHDLSVSYERVGDVLVAQGDRAAALQSYRAGLVIRERLAVSDRANADWQRDLIVSYVKLSEVEPTAAKSWLMQAKAAVEQLEADGRLAPVDAWMPAEIERLSALSR